MLIYLFLALSAAAVGLVATPIVRVLATRCGAVDPPGGRRMHEGHVPRLGGVAVVIAGLAAVVLVGSTGVAIQDRLTSGGWGASWLLLGTLIVVAIGVIDDVRNIGPLPKLGCEVLAGVFALVGGCGFSAVSNPFGAGTIELGALGGVFALVWIVGVTNAFNLIDGLDGLAAGVALIATATIFVVSLMEDRPDAAVLAATLGGALAAFLVYNFHPASIFLGDSGSLVLGYVLSLLAIQARGKSPTAVVILVPILALGLPIVDTLVTVTRRFLAAGSAAVFRADREHIHHRLVMQGMTPRRAVLLLYGVSAAFGALALLASIAGGPGSAAVVAVVTAGSYFGVRRLGYARPRKDRRVQPDA